MFNCWRKLIPSPTSTILCRGTHNTSAKKIINYSSPLESRIHNILTTEIQHQSDYAPPHQPLTEFGRFTIEDRPGNQWITLSAKSAGGDEDIKIEATMFDGCIFGEKYDDDKGWQKYAKLHISMSVDVWKGEGSCNAIKFACSAWPDSVEIEKVFVCGRDEYPTRLYTGPHFKNLNTELQTEFYQFLYTRGVNSDLSMFLHKYMMNKDRIELIRWLEKVNCFFQKSS